MPTSPIATAADYADAMLTARKARTIAFLILLLLLLAQLAVFVVAQLTDKLDPYLVPATSLAGEDESPGAAAYAAGPATAPAATATPATAPSSASPGEPSSVSPEGLQFRQRTIHYGVGLTVFLGVAVTVVLSLVLLLLVNIMLVGRLIGLSHVTAAWLWCVVLLALVFPWQAFLNNQGLTAVNFKVPGVLYSFDELVLRVGPEAKQKFPDLNWDAKFLHWARFVAWPVVALIILLISFAKSSRGLKLALGEAALEAANIEDGHGPDLR